MEKVLAQSITIFKQAHLILPPDKLQAAILMTMGIDAEVKRFKSSTLIKFKHCKSLYSFIDKIYMDVEFTVYSKPDCRFILEIKL